MCVCVLDGYVWVWRPRPGPARCSSLLDILSEPLDGSRNRSTALEKPGKRDCSPAVSSEHQQKNPKPDGAGELGSPGKMRQSSKNWGAASWAAAGTQELGLEDVSMKIKLWSSSPRGFGELTAGNDSGVSGHREFQQGFYHFWVKDTQVRVSLTQKCSGKSWWECPAKAHPPAAWDGAGWKIRRKNHSKHQSYSPLRGFQRKCVSPLQNETFKIFHVQFPFQSLIFCAILCFYPGPLLPLEQKQTGQGEGKMTKWIYRNHPI